MTSMSDREYDLRRLRDTMARDLTGLYDLSEARNIVEWIFLEMAGIRKIDFGLTSTVKLAPVIEWKLQEALAELKKGRPVQYVTGNAEFCGLRIEVDERVLIPRPETEDLVVWMKDDLATSGALKILDIGTGSGCVAIALKKILPSVSLSALDNSPGALEVARRNAAIHHTEIKFIEGDILSGQGMLEDQVYDVIVSNPPYITRQEALKMRSNVLDFEPHSALFVPDDDPFLFNRAIAAFSERRLKNNGKVYVEINEGFGKEVAEMFQSFGFSRTCVRKDIHGRDRMVRAERG